MRGAFAIFRSCCTPVRFRLCVVSLLSVAGGASVTVPSLYDKAVYVNSLFFLCGLASQVRLGCTFAAHVAGRVTLAGFAQRADAAEAALACAGTEGRLGLGYGTAFAGRRDPRSTLPLARSAARSAK